MGVPWSGALVYDFFGGHACRWYIRPWNAALGGNILKADVLWCRGAPYDAAGWTSCKISVFGSGNRRARGSRVLGPWPTSCLACGKGRSGRKIGLLGLPSRSLMLIAFGAAGNVPLATFSQVTRAEVAPVVPLWAPCDLMPSCITFSEDMRVGSGGACIP